MCTLYHFYVFIAYYSLCITKTKHPAFNEMPCFNIERVQTEIYWIPDGVAVTDPVRPLTVPSSIAEIL